MEVSEAISVVIPSFNEEEVIDLVLERLEDILHGQNYEIIVVDDGSIDNTAKVVKEKNIKLVRRPYNRGYGAAIKTGMKNATNELILIINADGTYPVKDIPNLLKYIDQYDMVVGARTGENVHIQLIRRPAKWLLSKTGGEYNDRETSFNNRNNWTRWSIFGKVSIRKKL